MLKARPYFEACDIFGEPVEVEALSGPDLVEFDRRLRAVQEEKDAGKEPNARAPFAFAFWRTVKRPGGAPVYATADEAAGEDLRTWTALLAAWRRVHAMDDAAGN